MATFHPLVGFKSEEDPTKESKRCHLLKNFTAHCDHWVIFRRNHTILPPLLSCLLDLSATIGFCPFPLPFRLLPFASLQVPCWPGDVPSPGRAPQGEPRQAGPAGLRPRRAERRLPRSGGAGPGQDEAVPAHRPTGPQAGSPQLQDSAQGARLATRPGEVSWNLLGRFLYWKDGATTIRVVKCKDFLKLGTFHGESRNEWGYIGISWEFVDKCNGQCLKKEMGITFCIVCCCSPHSHAQ